MVNGALTLARKLEWCASNSDYFSHASFHQRRDQGNAEVLRHLGVPGSLIGAILKMRSVILFVRRLVRRIAWPVQRS